MGQGFVLANLDKQEYVSPHDLGLGYKLGEFGNPNPARDFAGSLTQFAREITADGGKWHGDRVLYVGDYGDLFYVNFELPKVESLDYSFVMDTYTQLDKGEVRAWVAQNAEPESLIFRQRLWAMYDEVDELF